MIPSYQDESGPGAGRRSAPRSKIRLQRAPGSRRPSSNPGIRHSSRALAPSPGSRDSSGRNRGSQARSLPRWHLGRTGCTLRSHCAPVETGHRVPHTTMAPGHLEFCMVPPDLPDLSPDLRRDGVFTPIDPWHMVSEEVGAMGPPGGPPRIRPACERPPGLSVQECLAMSGARLMVREIH